MADHGGINFGGDARRAAHLALVQGGSSISTNATSAATRTLGTAPVAGLAPVAPRLSVATSYRATTAEAPRSRHEQNVRAVARNFDNFDDALEHMVRASGVSREAAASVAEAIKGNPALKAQAEVAFQRARQSVG